MKYVNFQINIPKKYKNLFQKYLRWNLIFTKTYSYNWHT